MKAEHCLTQDEGLHAVIMLTADSSEELGEKIVERSEQGWQLEGELRILNLTSKKAEFFGMPRECVVYATMVLTEEAFRRSQKNSGESKENEASEPEPTKLGRLWNLFGRNTLERSVNCFGWLITSLALVALFIFFIGLASDWIAGWIADWIFVLRG